MNGARAGGEASRSVVAATLAPISSPSKNTAAATNRRAIRLALLDPPAWRVVEHPASFTVQDARGQNVAWFHFRNDPGIAQAAAVRFKEDARRRAMNFT
jgi:hypothetical protein